MGTTKTIEKNASIEIFSPSVSPSAARDAEIKQSVEMELANFSPETSIPNPVMVDEIEEAQVSSAAEPPTIQRRVSGKQRRLSLEEYRITYLKVPVIIDRKPVFVSCEVRDRLEDYVRKLGGRKMSVSGLLENIARQHLDPYYADFEQWRKLEPITGIRDVEKAMSTDHLFVVTYDCEQLLIEAEKAVCTIKNRQ